MFKTMWKLMRIFAASLISSMILHDGILVFFFKSLVVIAKMKWAAIVTTTKITQCIKIKSFACSSK